MNQNQFLLPRLLLIYSVAIPLALVLGYVLATPDTYSSLGTVGVVIAVLLIPVMLRFHYALLLMSWNATLTVFFLPGQPSLWMLFSVTSLGISVVSYLINREVGFKFVPSVTWPIVMILLVVLITAKFRGGLGLRSMGSETYGGRRIFYILMAVAGYFALSCHRIPLAKAGRANALFWLSGLTSMLPNLIYMAGPAFWVLFMFFPVDYAASQVMEDFATFNNDIKVTRLTGFTVAGTALFSFILSKYGVASLFSLRRPILLGATALICILGLLGGFRSSFIILGLYFGVQFLAEGLLRTRLTLVLGLAGLLGFCALVPTVQKLPLSIQRSLSFLPLDIHPVVRHSAQGSLEWRWEMWQVLFPQVSQYLWLGKGYSLDPTDLYLTHQAVVRGLIKDYEGAVAAGDYHSGPLSILLPFGLPGMVAFIWFLIAAVRALYRNYRNGDPALQRINCFLFSCFVARVIFYFFGYGSFYSDLPVFLSLLGFSIALNGGVESVPAVAPAPAQPETTPALMPA